MITNDQHARKGVVHDKVDVGNHPNENGNQVICTDEQMYTKSQTHTALGGPTGGAIQPTTTVSIGSCAPPADDVAVDSDVGQRCPVVFMRGV